MIDEMLVNDVIPFTEKVADLNQTCLNQWWSASLSFVDDLPRYSSAKQTSGERQMEGLIGEVLKSVRKPPVDTAAWDGLENQWSQAARAFAKNYLDVSEEILDSLERDGYVAASLGFIDRARAFDPALSMADIFQAGRNVWTMNFIQQILGRSVELTPAIIAYSLLYPYTDNLLDDPEISGAEKRRFSARFAQRLHGEAVPPYNSDEEKIWSLVEMIEGQFSRWEFPQVYESLYAIHAAQTRSACLVSPGATPFEVDVLGITFDKGGTSVLADGYLVAGDLSPEQALFLYSYGAFTQLMDDQEDTPGDMQAGISTVFTLTAQHWPLDKLLNRTYHYLDWVMGNLWAAAVPGHDPLLEFIQRSIELLLADAAGRTAKYYTRGYLTQLESRIPFRYSSLDRQRKRIHKNQEWFNLFFDAWNRARQTAGR